MAIDAKLTTEEVIKELAQIAGRPTEDEDDKDKVADEDDGEYVRNEQLVISSEAWWLPRNLGNFPMKGHYRNQLSWLMEPTETEPTIREPA